jgi:uncharacterized membrane protein YoaK (UPF0700 family)
MDGTANATVGEGPEGLEATSELLPARYESEEPQLDEEQESDEEDEEENEAAAFASAPFFDLPEAAATVAPTKTKPTSSSVESLHSRFCIGLMSLSGLVEGYCLKRYGCFPNMMTGNAVKLVESLTNRWSGIGTGGSGSGSAAASVVVLYSSMMVMYFVGSSIFEQYRAVVDDTSDNNDNDNAPQDGRYGRLLNGSAALAMFVFVLSDLLAPALKLPLLSLSFGILHSVTMDTVGVVPFAMTGHMTKIGTGLTREYLLSRMTDNDDDRQRQQHSTSRGYHTSVRGMLCFMASAAVANVVYEMCQRHRHSHPVWSGVPSLFGTVLAVLYGCLFRWYTRSYQQWQQQQQPQPQPQGQPAAP